MPDAAIIGGGPAGSVAALLLGRAGWRVTLIEQQSFPRDKVCGECLSALGISVLRRLGLDDTIQSCSPALLTHASLHAPDGPSARFQLVSPMWGISRRLLDALLFDAARDAGAHVLQPARCESLSHGESVPQLTVRDLRTNHRTTLCPDHVLIADGKGALMPDRPTLTGDFGIKAHFTNVDSPSDTIALFGVRGHYGGVAPIEAERWNVAFSIPAGDLSDGGGDLDQLFASTIVAS